MTWTHRQEAFFGDFCKCVHGALVFQIRLDLSIFGVKRRRVDFGEDVALLHLSSVILVPHCHIARDPRIDRGLVPTDDIAGKRNGFGRWGRLWRDDGHRGYGVFLRLLAYLIGAEPALLDSKAKIRPPTHDGEEDTKSPARGFNTKRRSFGGRRADCRS